MKVLGISGSPRKDGNTDHAVMAALKIIGDERPDAEVEFLRIADYSIEHCRGCRHCMTHVKCAIEGDDLGFLVGKMLASDLIILGAPIYWWSPPGVLKDFIDRTHAFYPDDKRFEGKKVAVVTVAAQSGFPSHERTMGWLRHYGAEYVGWLRLYAREKGQLQKKPRQMMKLEGFAENLADIQF
jgi:multimeric flavodoxin WrbA